MLIRNGWVSNSSTSSFVVIYDDAHQFDKLATFDGYRTFLEDLNKAIDPERPVWVLAAELGAAVYETKESYISGRYRAPDYVVDELLEDYNVDDTEYRELFSKVCKKARELDEANPEDKREYEHQLNGWFYRDFGKEVYSVCEDLAKRLVEAIRKSGKKITAITYGNDDCKDYWERFTEPQNDLDTVNGAYMEGEFVPWVASMPNRKYTVIIHREH